MRLHRSIASSALLLFLYTACVRGFYLPGLAPQNYHPGDLVQLMVNRLTPAEGNEDHTTKSVFSFDYYHQAFHFCQPPGGTRDQSESIGSILFGDRIQTSPFRLRMGLNSTGCTAVCDEVTFEPKDAKFVNRRIEQDYNIDWLIDGLPAGSPFVDQQTGSRYYQPGFPLGAIVDDQPRLHNHYDIFVDYHEVGSNQFRVVGVQVMPMSLADSRRSNPGSEDDFSAECEDSGRPMVLSEKDDTRVTWTYRVYWAPSPTTFATRYDKYLHVFAPRIHWFSIVNSAVIVTFLIGMVMAVLNRTLKKDIARYNRLDEYNLDDFSGEGGEDGVQEDSGWKLVHGDAFRPPKYALLLAVFVGNGAQLFTMVGLTIAIAAVGFLSPSSRGALGSLMILLYTVCGFIGGYTSSRVYKSFRGDKWKQLFLSTPLLVPTIVFATFFLMNLFVWARQASGAVPFTTMLVIVGIYFVISVPLSLAGSWFGYKQTQADPPVKTNQIPRQIPPTSGYLKLWRSLLLGGVLPFGAIFIELYFIMSSLWSSSRIYYMFGFLFLCYGLMVITSAAVTIIIIYFVLCAENYHWQWRAFACSGASAGYVFAYSFIFWAQSISFSTWTGGLLFLTYSTLISFLWFILTG